MDEETSRRDLLKVGLSVAALGALPMLATADTLSISDVEADLGHPLPEEAKKLLRAALAGNASNAKERLKTKLPDCSEPCFTYRPTAWGLK